MAAHDEGQVPFDKLPKREIRDWIEDWLNLPDVNVLLPQAGGGGTITINNNSFTDTGFMRESGLVVPSGGYHTTAPVTANADDVLQARFIPRETRNITNLSVIETQQPTGASFLHWGIYSSDGQTLLVTSGAIAHDDGAYAGPRWNTFALGTTFQLVADTEYVLTILNDVAAGSWVYAGSVMDTVVRESYMEGTTTIANYVANGWESRFAGTGWTTLEDGTLAADATVAASTNVPIAVLS